MLLLYFFWRDLQRPMTWASVDGDKVAVINATSAWSLTIQSSRLGLGCVVVAIELRRYKGRYTVEPFLV